MSEREEETFNANIILLLAKDLGYLELTLILSVPCTNGHHQVLDIKHQWKAEGRTREGDKYYKICVYITLIVICNLNCHITVAALTNILYKAVKTVNTPTLISGFVCIAYSFCPSQLVFFNLRVLG